MTQPYQQYLASVADKFDFAAVLAEHKARFGDARMEDPTPPVPTPPPGQPSAPRVANPNLGNPQGAPQGAPQGDPQQPADPGFPADTPVKDMTPDQQAAYWRDKAQKHEKLWKAVEVTPEELTALREKADQHDALERELMSDHDKAVQEAREAARLEAQAEFATELVTAKFESASAGRLDADRLAKILAPLDLTKFLDAKGKVDGAKVQAYVDDVAPKSTVPAPRGPSATGLGHVPHTPGERGAQGKAMAEKRFGKTSA